MALSRTILRNIRDSHARQLAHFELPNERMPPGKTPPDSYLTLEDTIDWIKANPGALQAAKDAQCTSQSPSSPNWNTVFFTLVESAGVSFRKEDEIFEAIIAARKGDFDSAISHIEKSQETINEVAKALDCTFVQLCDFHDESPQGSCLHSGAFCGLFVSNDKSKPFMGVTYKGTSNAREIITDLDWVTMAPDPPEIAWGALVHSGFFKGLFGKFKTAKYEVAFDVMLDQLTKAYDDHGDKPILHFTGHSLGGAYCTLTYGEFLRRQDEPRIAKFHFGDMYSLAAPRVCTPPFFQKVSELTPSGGRRYLFRIVNQDDPVPTIPPPEKDQLQQYPYVHVGGAWELLESEGPRKMQDEPPPVDPQPIPDIILNAPHHQINEYYANWQNAPHA
ncbi:lipase precursor [Moniliophthora roreri MCA 2997]|uniref:Lipase n=1 Tax=Moniliophthora roreri (strain MCA 2997) TaxID=1381753 RepID=V2X0G6_MONRO|nr:lipase precursor [Moniliophthora roreri MCA 2997]